MANVTVPYSGYGAAHFEKLDNWLNDFLLAGSDPEMFTFPMVLEENIAFQRFQVVGKNVRGRLEPVVVTVVDHYSVSGAAIANAGSGGTTGAAVVTGTTGTGTKFQADVTIAGGQITAINDIKVQGDYTALPTNPATEPVTGGGLVGATLNLTMQTVEVPTYSVPPCAITTQSYTSAVGEVTTSQPVFLGGCFNIYALVFDASFTDDNLKLNVFFGAPSPTTIVLKTRPSGAPLT